MYKKNESLISINDIDFMPIDIAKRIELACIAGAHNSYFMPERITAIISDCTKHKKYLYVLGHKNRVSEHKIYAHFGEQLRDKSPDNWSDIAKLYFRYNTTYGRNNILLSKKYPIFELKNIKKNTRHCFCGSTFSLTRGNNINMIFIRDKNSFKIIAIRINIYFSVARPHPALYANLLVLTEEFRKTPRWDLVNSACGYLSFLKLSKSPELFIKYNRYAKIPLRSELIQDDIEDSFFDTVAAGDLLITTRGGDPTAVKQFIGVTNNKKFAILKNTSISIKSKYIPDDKIKYKLKLNNGRLEESIRVDGAKCAYLMLKS